MERAADCCIARDCWYREVRLESASVFDVVARAGERGVSSLRRERYRTDRLVSAGPGRIDRQVSTWPGTAGRFTCGESGDEYVLGRRPEDGCDAHCSSGASSDRCTS